jgi:hypothetical protein
MYSGCPVCAEEPRIQANITDEEFDLETVTFREIYRPGGVRIKDISVEFLFTSRDPFNAWRNGFIRRHGKSVICIETTETDGHCTYKYNVGGAGYRNHLEEHYRKINHNFTKINKHLGLC